MPCFCCCCRFFLSRSLSTLFVHFELVVIRFVLMSSKVDLSQILVFVLPSSLCSTYMSCKHNTFRTATSDQIKRVNTRDFKLKKEISAHDLKINKHTAAAHGMDRTSERARDGGDALQIGQYQGKWLNKRDNHRSSYLLILRVLWLLLLFSS